MSGSGYILGGGGFILGSGFILGGDGWWWVVARFIIARSLYIYLLFTFKQQIPKFS